MSSGPAISGAGSPSTARMWCAWWSIGLLTLLAVELLVFSIRLDTGTLQEIGGVWAVPFRNAALITQLAISAAVAVVLFGGDRLRNSFRTMAHESDAAPLRWLPAIVHLVVVAALYRLSLVVFDEGFEFQQQRAVWTFGWSILCAVAFLSWVASVVPFSRWRWLIGSLGKLGAASALLAVAALAVGALINRIWQPLAEWTFAIVAALLSPVYSNVIVKPAELVVGTNEFHVQIAPGCSGYEGIGLVVVFMSAFIWTYRAQLRFPHVLLLIPIGVVTIWILNAARIAALVAIGTSVSAEVAAGGFHSQAGWLAFNAVTVGLIAVGWNAAWFRRASEPSAKIANEGQLAAAPYLIPFLILIGTALLTGAVSSGGFDRLYGVRVICTGAALAYFAATYRKQGILAWGWSWHAVAIGVAVFAMWMALEPLAGVDASQSTVYSAEIGGISASLAALWLVLRAIGSVIVVPLAEELAFRGYLTRQLMAEDFTSVPMGKMTWFSCIASSYFLAYCMAAGWPALWPGCYLLLRSIAAAA